MMLLRKVLLPHCTDYRGAWVSTARAEEGLAGTPVNRR